MPNTFEKLSKADEARILSALEDISSLVNDGEDPNSAITKIAAEMKLPPGFIDPIVYAYNTSRTNIQRRTSDDIFEKAAEFPVADADIIRRALYPTRYKTAAELQRKDEVSAEYAMSPIWLERIKTTKVASAAVVLIDKAPDPYPSDGAHIVKQGYAKLQRHQQMVNVAAAERTKLFTNCVDRLNCIADYFKTAGSLPYQDVRNNITIMYGRDGEVIMNMVKDRIPEVVEKRASLNKFSSTQPKIYADILCLIKNITTYNRLNEKVAKLKELTPRLEGQFLRPFAFSPRNRSVILSPDKQAAFWGDIFGAGLNAITGSDISKNIASEFPIPGKPTDTLLRKDLQKLVDPAHEQTIREAQVEAMLNDLMANDEVIGTHKPEDVIKVFNELNQLAPRAANQKMLVRSLLRKRLQYGGDQVDPFDLQQLLDIEGKLKTREELGKAPFGAMAQGPLGVIGQ